MTWKSGCSSRRSSETSNGSRWTSCSSLGNKSLQSVTSSWGGRRYPPYAFTEQGVAMLSTVLKEPACDRRQYQDHACFRAVASDPRLEQGSRPTPRRARSEDRCQVQGS